MFVKMLADTIIQFFLQELKKDSENAFENKFDQNDINVAYNILEGTFKNEHLEDLKNKVKQLNERRNDKVRNLEKDEVGKFIYKTLQKIFSSTTKEERFLYLNDILDKTYDSLIQRLIEIEKKKYIISKRVYKMTVKKFIPFVKLDNMLKRNGRQHKEELEELVECLHQPEFLREDAYEIIKKKYGKQNVKYVGHKLTHISEKLGFLGEYARLQIFVELNQKVTNNFFIKFLPKGNDEITKSMATSSFIKEEQFYMDFINIVENITEEEASFLPKCYLVSENFIVLEDLSFLNYSSVNKLINLDYEHCSVVLKQLARLHSCSIILEEKLSKKLGKRITIDKYFPDMIQETFITETTFNIISIEHIVEYLKKFPNIVKDITMEEFQNRAKKNLNEIYKKVEKSKSIMNVLNHGDIWWTNIFYKFDSNKKPTGCLLFDFQLIRYAPAVCDILIFLHITTDRKTRQELTKVLLDDYYSELKSILRNYDIDIERMFPYSDLLKSLEDLKILGIYLGTLYLYVNALPSDQFNKVYNKDSKESATRFYTEIDFRCKIFDEVWDQMQADKRLEENALDLYEYCLKNA